MSNTRQFNAIYAAPIIGTLCLLTACGGGGGGGGGAPTTTTDISLLADLPSNVVRLANQRFDIQAQITTNDTNQVKAFITTNSAEQLIEDYDLTQIKLNVIISVDIEGNQVTLAETTLSKDTQPGQQTINITDYQYPDLDGDGVSNLTEIVNGSDYTNANSIPEGIISTAMRSENYSIEPDAVSELNYAPSSNSYSITNTKGIIFNVENNISQSTTQFEGSPLYQIITQ
ncbi:hypothetical protein MNBD_GAMMA07-134 [hydrothermal vent metagenome]|uniref:Lipoprotein n=1 Tax=hydrothermal vent metagenome TaxID=652676 RepID=A0A3B0X2G9_9ZZZZ